MRKEYDLLLIGATALAVGIVQAHSELRIAVLEEGFSVAGEFCHTWRTNNAANYIPKSAAAQQLRQQLVDRCAISAEGEWLPAVQPILADLLRRSNADVYFFGAIAEIQSAGNSCRIIWSAYGIDHSFCALSVIDTTAHFLTAPFWGLPQPACKFFLNHIDASHTIYSTPCATPDEGRRTIIRNDKDILLIATHPVALPTEKRQTHGRLLWLPSAAYGNFLEAFDAGTAAELPQGQFPACYNAIIDEGYYDVIVVGIGTAGAMAALAAHQEKLSVLGIEKLPIPGGTSTAGRVTGYYFGYHGGLYTEVDAAAHQFDSSFIPMARLGADQKINQINRTLSACDIRTDASFLCALTQGEQVTGIRWQQDGRLYTARAGFVIDATAEAAVCVSAGCQMLGGRSSDGKFQPYTCVHLKHTDGKLSWGNMDQGRVDQYDPDDLGHAVLGSFTSPIHLRENYSDRTYMGIVPLLGLREGRRIVGEEAVSFHDLIHGKFHAAPAYYCWSNFDNHGKDIALESRDFQDWVVLAGLWGWGISVPVPMGAMIPKGFQGLLAAGRCVSVDHDTAFGVRMRDDTSKSGEAAAKLAALSLRSGKPAKDISPEALRQKLFATNCLKPEDEILRLEKQRMGELYEKQLWCLESAEITEGLASDAPGYYIWSAKLLGDTDYLKDLLAARDKNTRYHAALALALLGNDDAQTVDILQACALETDGYLPSSGRKYVHPRSVSAIYALGRIGSPLAIPALFRLLEQKAEVPFTPDLLLKDQEDLQFQYHSHALAALLAIAKAAPEQAEAIHARLAAYLECHRLTVSLISSPLRFDCTDTFLQMLASLG